jgi:signal transduction histidine kinase
VSTGRRLPRGLLPRTLRARVTALAAVAVLGVLAAASVGLVVAQRAVLVDAVDDSVDRQADAVVAQLRRGEPVRAGDLPSEDVVVEVVGPDGTMLAASEDLEGRLPGVARDGDGSRITTVDLPGDDAEWRLLSRDVRGTTVLVAGTLDDVADGTAALAAALLVAVPLTAIVLAGVVWWAVGRALRPVEDIRARVDSISGARLDRRVPEPATPEEISRLARTMNAMLGRLQESAERQRRFVGDASHELRSPLARMRTELEVDQAHPGSADPAATSRSVLDETVALQRLVDDLLLLARGDAGALDPGRSAPVDLDDVVEKVVAGRRGTGERHIDVRGVRPVQVAGDGVQLERAVGNLLDNALRHARSTVSVALEDSAGTAVLTVADDGPGIPPGAADLVFRRFTRLDDARSAGSGGAGLGLAIARDIAERHGGSLVLAPQAPTGARLVLSLPVARVGDAGIGRSGPE